jgi:hypothetical protein
MAITILDNFFVFARRHNVARHKGPAISTVDSGDRSYDFAVLDFDDQGICFNRGWIAELSAYLEERKSRWPIIVVFVHGWKHTALADDQNLLDFQATLRRLAHSAARSVGDHKAPGADASPVLGVYLGWRGASRLGNWFWQQSSFWNRQRAAQRVATGTPREVLGLLKRFRNGDRPEDGPRATLVVVGHSFGGLIVYTAIAQSLIEAASTQKGEIAPSFGDLVVLLNPAFSAISYVPITEIVSEATFRSDQRPVMISVTAINDWATKYAFPLGNLFRRLGEACRGSRQREALRKTMGHVRWMRTHHLSRKAPVAAAVAEERHTAEQAGSAVMQARGGTGQIAGVEVTNVDGHTTNPFWVADADPTVINGHNGITDPAFAEFIAELVEGHIMVTTRAVRSRSTDSSDGAG